MTTDAAGPSRSLDLLNFFLADVRDGLGPYLAIYLLSVQHWNEADIGLVMTLAGLAGLAAQIPAGALVDGTRYKRAVVVVAALLVTVGSLSLPWLNDFTIVAVLQSGGRRRRGGLSPGHRGDHVGDAGTACLRPPDRTQ